MSELTLVSHDEKLALVEAAKRVPGRPHASALWRWARRGVRATNGSIIKLECWQYGRKLFTTAIALDDFAARLSQANAENFDDRGGSGRNIRRRKTTRATKQRAASLAATDAELSAAGF